METSYKTNGKRKLDPNRMSSKNEKRKLDPSRMSYDSAFLYSLRQRGSFDTLDQDAEKLRSSLGSVGSEWQDSDSMERRGQELASIQDRLAARRQYLSIAQLFPNDFDIPSDENIQRISDWESQFRSISDSFDSLRQMYGAFGSAEEYKKASEYSRLTAEDIPRLEKEIEEVDSSIKRLRSNASLGERLGEASGIFAGVVEGMSDSFSKMYKDSEYHKQKGELAQKRKELEQAKHAAYGNVYASVKNNADYEEMSQKPDLKLNMSSGMAVPGVHTKNDKVDEIAGRINTAGNYDLASEDEVGIFNYFYNTNQKDLAEKYYNEFLRDPVNARQGVHMAKQVQEIENSFLKALAYGGSSLVSGIDQFATGVRQIGEDSQITSPVAFMNGELSNDLSGAAKYLYLAGNTVGNMLPSIIISAATGGVAGELAGAASMGVSAGGNAYGQALAEGYSKDQARAYGMLVGASEGALQYALGGISKLGGKIGLGNLAEKAAAIDNAFLRASAKLGANILDEIKEEELQNFLDPLFRTVLFGEEYDAPTVGELVETAIVTALSTGTLEVGGVYVNDARADAFQSTQLDMRYSGQDAAFVAAVEQVLGKERTAEVLGGSYLPTVGESKKVRKAAEKDSAYTTNTLNEYAQALAVDEAQVNPDGAELARLQKKLNKNKNITGKQIDRVENNIRNRWQAQQKSAPALHDKEVIRNTAAERLAELGEYHGEIPPIASAIAKQVAGEKLTRQERQAIDASAYGECVANELNPENAGTGQYSNAYIDEMEPTQFYGTYYEDRLQQKQDMEVAEQRAQSGVPYVSYAPENTRSAVLEKAQETAKSALSETVSDAEGNMSAKGETSGEGAENDATESSYEASADGQTILHTTGETVRIAKVASMKDGTMQLALDNGETVDAQDVSYASAEEAVLYETVANLGTNAEAANMLINNYSPADGISADVYAHGIAEAYKYGYYGIPVQETRRGAFAADISPAQRELAYNMGRSDRTFATETAQKAVTGNKNKSGKKKTGRVYFEPGVRPETELQKVSVRATEKIAEALGTDIYFYASKVNEKGKRVGDNGWYDPKDGSIHLDIHAGMTGEGTILFNASHELVHFIRQWSPAKFRTLADFLFAEYGEKGVSVEALIQDKMNRAKEAGREISYDEAYEEVVAHSCEKLLADGAAVEKLAKLKAQDKRLWNKIKEYITALAAKIRKVYEGLLPDSAEGRYIAQMKDTMERLQELFIEGLSDAGENYQAARNGEKQGVDQGTIKFNQRNGGRYDYSKSFAEQIDDYKAGKIPKGDTLIVGATPEVFQKIGFNALPMTINTTHVDYALNGTRDQDHFLGEAMLKQLPQSIKDPAAIISSRTQTGTSLVVLLPIKHKENTVVVPVYIDGLGFQNGICIDSNAITSIYGKNNAVTKLLNDAIREERNGNIAVYYYNKKIADPLLQIAGLQLPGGLIPRGGYVHSIRESGSPVKAKFENVTYSQQFKRWFGDWQKHPDTASKVVNKDGTPKVVYHGTDEDFTVFDITKSRSYDGNSDGYLPGFYFSESYEESNRHGEHVNAYYLSIRNPYEGDIYRLAKEKGSYRKAYDYLVEQGYDGVIMDDMGEGFTEYIVLKPNQIKSATDNIGTFDGTNNDVLYSMRDPDLAREFERENQILETENEQLREDVEELQKLVDLQDQLTLGTKFTKTSVLGTARNLKRDINAAGDTKQLAGLLTDFYEFIASSSGQIMTWDDVMEAAAPAVDWLMENMKGVHYTDEHVQEVLRDIRGSRIYLDDVQKAEAANIYGSYNAFRKQTMGSIIIANNDSVSLDTKWQEWSMLYPEYFDADVVPGDMPAKLMETIDILRGAKEAVTDLYSPELTRQEILTEVYDSYWRVSTLYTVADAAQKEINQLKIQHFKQMDKARQRYNRLKKEHKKKTAKLRQKYREASKQKQAEIVARYQASRKKGIENRKKTAKRREILKVGSELSNMLLHGTKERHVLIEMQKPVAQLLDAFDMDTVGAEKRIAKYDALIAKETDPAKIEGLIESRERIRSRGENIGTRLASLKTEYAKFINSEDPLIANSHDEVIENRIAEVSELVGDTSLRDMSLEQLEAVSDVFKMVLTSVKNANKAFKINREVGIAEQTRKIEKELTDLRKKIKIRELFPKSKQFSWEQQKPIYAVRRIGSRTFEDVYWALMDAEGGWATEYGEHRAFLLGKYKEYGYNSWDPDEKRSFKSADGRAFSMGLEERMDFYLASRREQGRQHLLNLGFGFETDIEIEKKKAGIPVKYKKTTKENYLVTEALIDEICGTLTDQQKKFAEDLQQYLAKVIGAQLNEVSLRLYGIKSYNEITYWPLSVMTKFIQDLNARAEGKAPSITNMSFTHALNKNANSPILIGKVTDVWARHVFDACVYHNYALPMEDFRRILGYKTEHGDYSVVERALRETYGTGPMEYMQTLYEDLNGGPIRRSESFGIDKFLSLAKRNAVITSWSVVIQQPTAILRACAYINPIYFVTAAPGGFDFAAHNKKWEECKKYAPVAQVKEMGYFDVGMGKGAVDWLTAKEYKGRKKIAAFFKDGSYREEVLSKAPALADELAWVYLWEAVKRETKARTDLKLGSEEFLQHAGKRFTEIVALTQVYDSTLSRSGHMRKRDAVWKMATAFMAENTVTENMLVDAAVQGKRIGGIKGAKLIAATVNAFVLSQLFTAIAKSFVTAGRDDDEDKTYLEKYHGEVVSNFLDDINPLTYVPLLKDAMSLLKGYSVDRMDMDLVADLIRACAGLGSEKKSEAEKIADLAGSISAFTPIPLKNIIRDIKGADNFIKSFFSDNKTTKVGIEMAIEDAVGKKNSDGARIWKYYSGGEISEAQDHVSRMIAEKVDSGAMEEDARTSVRTSVTSYIKPLYLDAYANGSDAQADMICDLMEDIDLYDNPAKTRKKWVKDAKSEVGERAWKYYSSGKTSAAVECVKRAIRIREQEGETKKEAEAAVCRDMSALLEPLYLDAYKAKNDERMRKIRYLMRDIGIYGSAGKAVDVCVNWVKEAYR